MLRQLLRNIYKFQPKDRQEGSSQPVEEIIWNLSVLRQHYMCDITIGDEKTLLKKRIMQSSPHPPKTKEDIQYIIFSIMQIYFDKLLPFNIASYQSPLY
jgi:hypothetical protein